MIHVKHRPVRTKCARTSALAASALTASALVGALTACAGSSGSSLTSTPSGSTTTLTVFAAASLKRTFTELGRSFEATHPGAKLTLSFAGSSNLVAQLADGAPADVLATADRRTMTKAAGAKLVGSPTVFATNTLALVTAPGNPRHLTGLRSLTSGVTLVDCAPEVPCGAAAETVARSAGVTLHPVSQENSVTDVLGKVTSGEADAGLVYRTDARAAGKAVTAVAIPEATTAVNAYPIAVTASTPHPSLAREFVDLVTGPQGQRVLGEAGFGAPSATSSTATSSTATSQAASSSAAVSASGTP